MGEIMNIVNKNIPRTERIGEISYNRFRTKMLITEYINAVDAFAAYKVFKENLIRQAAHKYADIIPSVLYDAMLNYRVEISD